MDLAKRGATVVLACRDYSRGSDAAEYIRKESGNLNVFFEQIDLADFDSVKSFSQTVLEKFKGVDILINNAGNLLRRFQIFQIF